MNISDFRKDLFSGIVLFTFEKKNGDLRESLGSTHHTQVPKYNPKTTNKDGEEVDKKKVASPTDVVKFWDIDKKAWRSFRWDQFVEVLDFKELLGTLDNRPIN